MKKLKALDLFCGAGGAAMGLHRAGFEVFGVDIKPQRRYPFNFACADAMTYPLEGYDLIWASPPCQGFTAYKRRPNHVKPQANLIPQTRARLKASGALYVIENIPRAPLVDPVLLCGSMFGLEVRRHRLFESNFYIRQPHCRHSAQRGSFAQASNRENRRKTCEIGVWRIPLGVQRKAMGIDWMTLEELSEAIPPVFAEAIGIAASARIQEAA